MASVSKRPWTASDGTKREAWIVRWVDQSGAHRQKTCPSKKAADKHKLKIDHEKADRGSIGYVEDRTLKAIATEYTVSVDGKFEEGRITRGTLANVTTAVRCITRDLGSWKASEIMLGEIVAWYHRLRSGGLKSNTAHRRVEVLRDVLDFAVRRGCARDNQATAALKEIGGRVKIVIRQFTPDQVHQLLAAARERRKWQQKQTWRLTETVVHIGAFCGLRIGEILALTLDNIDLDARVLYVRHTINPWDEVTKPKTPSSHRPVPLPLHIVPLLQAWIAEFYVPNSRRLVFRSTVTRVNAKGGKISAGTFGDAYWRKLLKHAGLSNPGDEFHFHALRHFAGSWWLHNKVPVPDVSKLMGHANASVTMGIYAHALMNDEQRSTAVDASAAALIGSGADPQIAHELRTDKKVLCIQ